MEITQIVFPDDPMEMNWLREDYPYAQTKCPAEITAQVRHTVLPQGLRTEIVFTNATDKPVFSFLRDVSIRFPLQDRYESAAVCLRERCHTHIHCGLDISYVCALRMGGEAPHLGMVLTQGSLGGYSVERDLAHMSNDRGCFLLHPSPMEWQPGESHTVAWEIFSHGGWEDFFEKAARLRPFLRVEADRWIVFPGEKTHVRVRPSWTPREVWMNDQRVLPDKDGSYVLELQHSHTEGERTIAIRADQVTTRCTLLFHGAPEELARKRCGFIREHQQYRGPHPGLQGAYLAYDNDEEHPYYSQRNDWNGGRERVGMGLLMCRRLRMPGLAQDERIALEESLAAYTGYVLRELVQAGCGEVCNDFNFDQRCERLYNMPWYATFFVERYELYGKKEDLLIAYRIVKRFYEKGGAVHYAIELPVLSLCRALRQAGEEALLASCMEMFTLHGDKLIEIGRNYPPFEVNYEQSIVAPAANILLQLAVLTGERKYREEGERQMQVLALFNGRQPDYHLYETAIRHWDGYWFGKRALYGDTFPHYWSALTGNCYALRYVLTHAPSDRLRAQASLRGVLPLIHGDGRASCAFVYPLYVNGVQARGFDPCANDQDWALYFYLRMQQELAQLLADA